MPPDTYPTDPSGSPPPPPVADDLSAQEELKANILIVDDRPDKLIALESVVAELKQNIVIARSGREALRWLLRQDFAVILLDVNMPEMDGFETAAMIRSRPRSQYTPIIFISAVSDTDNHLSRGYSLGAVDYILSPIVPEILRAKVAVFVELFRKTSQIRRQAEERARLLHTEAARAEAEAAQERSAFLAEASSVLSSTLDFEQTFANLARIAVPRLADYCLIDSVQEDGSLRTVATAHRDPAQSDKLSVYRSRFPLEDMKWGHGHVLRTGRTEVCNRIDEDRLEYLHALPERAEAMSDLRVRSYLIAALPARGRYLGTITFLSASERAFGEHDVPLAEELARRAGLALDNASLYASAQRAQAEAENANRAKDQFLAMLSHELRTPLTPVLTTIALLDEDPVFPDELRPSLEVMRRNVRLEARLIDDLLDLTRISKGKIQLELETIDAHTLLNRALEICQADIRDKQLDLTVETKSSRSSIRADAARLQQVFWNLIKNAVKFTPVGGKLLVQTDEVDGFLQVVVSDTGLGIETEVLPRIFNAFEQGPSGFPQKAGGLGLGLAITKTLVNLHGGQITATSPGRFQGATFTVSLPLTNAPAIPKQVLQPVAPKASLNHQPRLLVVEDHEDSNRSLCQLLRKRGYELQSAFSVEEAIQLASQFEFDVLVSDIGLPDGTGIDLINRLTPHYTFGAIALTGFGMEADIQNSRAAGFAVHLTKPIDIGSLTTAIQTLVAASKSDPTPEVQPV